MDKEIIVVRDDGVRVLREPVEYTKEQKVAQLQSAENTLLQLTDMIAQYEATKTQQQTEVDKLKAQVAMFDEKP